MPWESEGQYLVLGAFLTPSSVGILQRDGKLEIISDCCGQVLKWSQADRGWYCSMPECGAPFVGLSHNTSSVWMLRDDVDPDEVLKLMGWVCSWTGLNSSQMELTVTKAGV